jgi:CCR4-NOT transcription complex subunit 2
MFRQEKEAMGSPTPQLSSFGNNLYAQSSGVGTASLQQRTLSNLSFAPTLPSTSLGAGVGASFPLSLQQQMRPQPVSPTPNRSMFSMNSMGQSHNLLSQFSSQPGLGAMKRPNILTPGLLSGGNTLTNIGNFSRPMSDGTQPSFDWSTDFPSIGNRNSAAPSQLLPSRNYVGMVSKPPQEPTPEFQIQQEDFPALPGAQNPSTTVTTTTISSDNNTSKSSASVGSYDAALKETSAKLFTEKTVGQQRRGIQTHPDGTVSNIPSGMVADQFGIVGLLTFIRAAELDPNLVALVPGIDLTTLGLNLNSTDNLYSTFQSPWADAPCRPQDIDYHVPSEYLTNVFIREKLAPIKLNRYQEDLLFYLFYVNGGDVLQLAAAAELYNRDWRYHKEERVWITRAPGMEPVSKTSSYERGTYFFFDVHNWRKVAKEFHLDYSKLEDRPQLPEMIYKST